MRVITVDNNELISCCDSLQKSVLSSGFYPDLILGIESGGIQVATILASFFKEKPMKLEFCHPVRFSSVSKKSFFKNHLKKLPVGILNFLRMVEFKFFFKRKNRKEFQKIVLPPDIGNFKKILVVDDAVDTGVTLKEVVQKIKNINPQSEILSAVITMTKNNPIIIPDYAIYRNGTLIRFPWSIDAK